MCYSISTNRVMSNLDERKNNSMSFGSTHTVSSDGSGGADASYQLVTECEEIFPNPIVSKKGYINVQPHHRNRWSKCYVVRNLAIHLI